jgi:hypothetical protein
MLMSQRPDAKIKYRYNLEVLEEWTHTL